MKTVIISKTKREELPDLVATVDMTARDAEMFKEFQKDYVNYLALKEGRVFEIKAGSAKIHFDPSGTIKAIDVNLRTL